MTENRGGRRVPNKPASYSGVGKNSKRTDGQPIRTPNVQDSTDLTQGDRAKLEAGQRIAPLRRTPDPKVTPVERAAGGMGRGTQLPPELMGLPSTRPGEPVTAGLAMGPGPGPEALRPQPQDDREVVLQWLASQPNAPQAIVDMQNEIRNSRMAPTPQRPQQPARPQPVPEPTEELQEDEIVEEPEDVSPIEPVMEEEEAPLV